MTFTNNPKKQRYELQVGSELAVADYRLENNSLYIDRVFVPETLRGQGVAARLMQAVIEAANQSGLAIIPVCSYAKSYMQKYESEN